MSMSINGTNGLTFNDASTQNTAATGFGFKNRIINGAMVIAQRGTSFTSPGTLTYTLDRWLTVWGGASPTFAQVAGPTGFKNALQITGIAANTSVYAMQRIESYNCTDLVGQSVAISATLQASTTLTVSWVLYYANTIDNWIGGYTAISSGTWSASTSAASFAATVSNLPVNAANGLMLAISPNSQGAFTSGTLNVTGVQLEKGSTATDFDYRPYGTELALCQRYLPAFIASNTTGPIAVGFSANSTLSSIIVPFGVTARVRPTGIFISSTPHFALNTSASLTTCNAVNFSDASTNSGQLTVSNAAVTAGQGCQLVFNSASGYLLFTGCEL